MPLSKLKASDLGRFYRKLSVDGGSRSGPLAPGPSDEFTAFCAARSARKAALLMTPTNEAAERLNARCQHTRIRHGELDTSGPSAIVGVHRIFVGDEIATRHNDRRLVTDRV